jgi:hypothetical protein
MPDEVITGPRQYGGGARRCRCFPFGTRFAVDVFQARRRMDGVKRKPSLSPKSLMGFVSLNPSYKL